MKKVDIVFISIGVVVLILIFAVFSLFGSPFEKQKQAHDQVILNSFNLIKVQVEKYYDTNKQVPLRLEDLDRESLNQIKTANPKVNQGYSYKKVSTISYDLCATFEANSAASRYESKPVYDSEELSTSHKSGYDCITYKIPSYLLATPIPDYYRNR